MFAFFDEATKKKMLALKEQDPTYAALWQKVVVERSREAISQSGILRSGDTQDWWRCLPRVAIVALALAFSLEDPKLRTWLKDAVNEICELPDDQWIGPFFRPRKNPPCGALETAHILQELVVTLALCPETFSPQEVARIRERVRTVGLPMTQEFLRLHEGPVASQNNWSIVLTSGLMYAGVLLEDRALLQEVVRLYNHLVTGMNDDFYGETVEYWGYAASIFSEIRLVLERDSPDIAAQLASPQGYARCLPWALAQEIGAFSPEAIGKSMPRFINFSDSDALWRISDKLLMDIALRTEEMPDLAALAAQSYRVLYRPAWISVPNEERLGFWKQVSIWSILCFPDLPHPESVPQFPDARRFSDGLALLKRKDGLMMAARSGGEAIPAVVSHRHADQGALFAAYQGIVLLDDPGRCCYRLPQFLRDKADAVHSLPFFTEGETALHQRIMDREDAGLPCRNQDRGHVLGDDFIWISGETGTLYPEPMRSVSRRVLMLGDHAALIEDHWEAGRPVVAGVRFVGNNRCMEMKWQLSGGEGTLCREGVGVRLISLEGIHPQLGYGTLHDLNHVNPNGPTQGREGSSYHLLFTMDVACEKGALRTVLLFDAADRLAKWQVSESDGHLTIVTPEDEEYARLEKDGSLLWHQRRIHNPCLG